MKNSFEFCSDKDLCGSWNALRRAGRRARSLLATEGGCNLELIDKRGAPMGTKTLIDSAMKLGPAERFELIDELLHSLDRPDPELDRIWIEEAERRLAAYRTGRVQGIPASDVVGEL